MSHDIIVKQRGGSIDVETEPGLFTEFKIVLPRTTKANPPADSVKFAAVRESGCGTYETQSYVRSSFAIRGKADIQIRARRNRLD